MIDDFKRPPARRPARLDSMPYSQPVQPPGPPQPNFMSPNYGTPSQGTYRPPQDFDDILPEPTGESSNAANAAAPKKRFFLFRNWHRPSRRQTLLISSLVLILIGGGVSYALTRPEPAPVAKVQVKKPVVKPAPPPILSPLTGMVVTAEQQIRPVTGVMIENSPDARPQSGLKEAGIVFEAVAEAGITRFLTLFQESSPANLGPIRSVRPYYIDWAMPFDASLAHVGGSPDALQRIKDVGTKDLDQFQNAGAFRRINTRYAPHNMYSTMDQLVAAGNAKGFTKSTFTPIERKAKEEPSKAPTAQVIDMAISSAYYNVHYEYDKTTNAYKRSMGGSPHIDMESKTQLEPKVVVGLVMGYGIMANGLHSEYTTVGTGLAYFFQDGIVTTGSWSKADYKSQFVFKDDAGNAIKLNPGQTWFSIVSDASKVAYRP